MQIHVLKYYVKYCLVLSGDTMRQTGALIKTLKEELRRKGITYRDVAKAIELSEASVKRLFADTSFSLERLDVICELLGMELTDLVRLMESDLSLTSRLTLSQELELVSDIKLLLMAHFLINGVLFCEIIDSYNISEPEGIRLLVKLDRLKIIELLPENRVKVIISNNFQWIHNGPIQNFYEKTIQEEFFKSSFSGQGEVRMFVSGMLTRQSNSEMIKKISHLCIELNELSHSDRSEDINQRFGTSLVVAMRPWEPEVFKNIRVAVNDKVF